VLHVAAYGSVGAKRYRSHEIAIIDENSSYLGVERRLLMENAGASVARVVMNEIPDISSSTVLVVAGPGNNGGDAFVAARHLSGRAAKVHVVLLAHPTQIRTEEAAANWRALEKMKVGVETHTALDPASLAALQSLFQEADIIIDGIFGTGIRGEIREPFRSAIEFINSSNARIFSIDVPSGVDPNNGEYSLAVKPHVTVTLHGPKPFMYVLGGEAGRVYVEGIGAPPEAEVIAGPGDLAYVKSLTRRVRGAVVRGVGELAEGAADALSIFGVEPETEGAGGEFVVRVEDVSAGGVAEASAGRRILVRPVERPSIEEAVKLSRSAGIPVYLVGCDDAISDGVCAKSNWLEPPTDSGYVAGVMTALSATFASWEAEPIYALGAACYSARHALKNGGSSNRAAYLERLRMLISEK